MMKRLIIISFIFFVAFPAARASHITGGEMFYTLVGMNNGMYQYSVTLKLFQRCESGRVFPNPTIISIFDLSNGNRVVDLYAQISSTENISITDPDPCITNPPRVCYDVAYYTFSVSLLPSAYGYVMASQVNYRINGINNLAPGSGNVGATYTAEIPGTSGIPNAPQNNSAHFTGSDLVIVCANNEFSYSFAAQDSDGDQLTYSFCEAYASTSNGGGAAQPTGPPPFPSVPYNLPAFSDSAPLGSAVQINSTTGLITGIAPSGGIYVVTVCVNEIRNGVIIARQRKDIQIHVADCSIASASLLPEYMLCRNTQTMTIANQSNSPLIVTTDWEFIDNTGAIIYSSSTPVVTYTFPAIGVYTIKLIINRNQPCTDSTTAIVRVFPGFFPDFTAAGICVTKPTQFTDLTTSVYGTPNGWNWDFGDPFSVTDVSSIQNPVYTYSSIGAMNVRLIATDTRGCRDTIVKAISILEKPIINLAFRDTLICKSDNLVLQAAGIGSFSWSPLINITNPNTPTPTVSPVTTTIYYVDLNDNGCRNKDSVKVNVVDFVTLQAMNDTTICRGDTIQLRVFSDGLQYSWTPAGMLINATIKNPFAISTAPQTNYQVMAVIGGCSATDNILVRTVPYPLANAGGDYFICYNATSQLNGSTDGSSWNWTPAAYMNNPLLLNPIIFPPRTTDFVLTAYDNKGCPKPGRDTIRITVMPKMHVSAGADTAAVINQPVQLNATGGIAYSWFPPAYLSATNIPNPIAIFDLYSEAIRYKVVAFSEEGCRDSAYISIKLFKTGPSVFVPTAFTPNNDGKNDLLRPIAVGIKTIEYFNVYNRWGQLLFSTQSNGHGWDGRINGQEQATGTFVWSVKAIDYTGKAYFQKGTVTLIR
jgi:gliding motility-associated-like protein